MSKTYTTVQGDRWDSVAYTQLGSCALAPHYSYELALFHAE